jgi:epoxyqueuosine reductase
VALGNARASDVVVQALRARADDASGLVREHVAWALGEQARRGASASAGASMPAAVTLKPQP